MSDAIIEQIVSIASTQGAQAILELTIAATDEELYDAAIDAFGSWDGALAAVVVELAGKQSSSRAPSAIRAREEEVVRKTNGSQNDPIFAATTGGGLFWIDGSELDITATPDLLPTPSGLGVMCRMHWLGDPDGVFVFSNLGRYYGLITRVVPQWMGETPLRPFGNILPAMNSGEQPMFVLPRRAGGGGRILHVTRQGKGKATEATEFGRTLDQTGREAFLLNDGDIPAAVMSADESATIFVASAMGQGIHFESADMRSMGRKAVGVNVIKLSGSEDHVVNAFVGDDVEQVAMITAQGLAKRVWFDEFRTQGRGGGGMQLCKLGAGDRVVGVVPLDPSEDLAVLTSLGRCLRTEATTFELMGRPARGNKLFEPANGETIVGLGVLPTSTDAF